MAYDMFGEFLKDHCAYIHAGEFRHGPLETVRQGEPTMLETGDGFIVHTRWQVTYRRTKDSSTLETIATDSVDGSDPVEIERKIVTAAGIEAEEAARLVRCAREWHFVVVLARGVVLPPAFQQDAPRAVYFPGDMVVFSLRLSTMTRPLIIAIDGPAAAQVAQGAFAGSPGLEAEAVELADGGYAWVDVLAVTPERQKPFEDVKAEVMAAAVEEQKRAEIASYAGKLVDRLNKGETMEAVAKETSAKVQKAVGVMRNAVPQGLTQGAVQQAFALPKGGASSALTADGKSRIILRVAEVTPAPAATPEQVARLKAEITRQMQGDVIGEYLDALQKRYGLAINEAALRQALGTSTQQQDIE
jgi:hypothetical protein